MIRELFLGDFSLSSCIWQSTIFIVVGLVGSFILRHRSSRAHQVLFLAMMAAVIVPIMSILVKHYELGVFVAEPVAIQSRAEDVGRVGNFGAPGIISAEDIEHKPGPIEKDLPSAMAASEIAKFSWRSVVLYGWIAASLILAARLLITFVRGVRLLGRALPLDCQRIKEAAHLARAKLGIDKDVKVYSSRGVRSPVIWCWRRRPVLLVPNAAGRFNNGIDWAGVLCHELAHWKRRDHISGLLAELAVCILPWHPLIWWAKSRLVRLSEQACDDWVVATGQPGTDYAESLLDLTPGGQMAFVPAVVSSKRGLAGRVHRILKDSCGNPRTGVIWALAVSIVAVCLTVGVACAQTRPAKPKAATEHESKYTESLIKAATDGDIEQVKSLISKGADVNARDKDGWTPLHLAARHDHANVAELLIAKRADVNAKNDDGETSLYVACYSGHRDVVELLLGKGADMQAANKWGGTPLQKSAEQGRIEIAKLLLTKGADIEARDRWGRRPLSMAASKGRLEMVRLLLSKGANIEARDSFEKTPLHEAVTKGKKKMVQLLLAKGADLRARAQGYTLVLWAMWKNDRDMVRFLMDKGAEFSDVHVAAYFGRSGEVLSFLSAGGDIDARDQSGLTLTHSAICGGHTQIIESLIAKGANVNAQDSFGWAPLHTASAVGREGIVQLLLAEGADVSSRDREGRIALHWAAMKGHKAIVEMLLANGSDVNIKVEFGYTVLHSAVNGGDNQIVELLLAHGADLNIKAGYTDWEGWTPFHVACRRGKKAIVEMLIDKGADINAKTNKGYTPLSLAKQWNHKQIVELLRKHGAKE